MPTDTFTFFLTGFPTAGVYYLQVRREPPPPRRSDGPDPSPQVMSTQISSPYVAGRTQYRVQSNGGATLNTPQARPSRRGVRPTPTERGRAAPRTQMLITGSAGWRTLGSFTFLGTGSEFVQVTGLFTAAPNTIMVADQLR